MKFIESLDKKRQLIWQRFFKKREQLFFTCPNSEDGKYGNGEKIEEHVYAQPEFCHHGDIHYFSDSNDIDSIMKGFKIVKMEKKEHWWMNENEKQLSLTWIGVGEKI